MDINQVTIYEFEEKDIIEALCAKIGFSATDPGVKADIRHRFSQLDLDGGGATHYSATVSLESKSTT